MIFFYIFDIYYYYLLTFLIHAYLTQTVQVLKLLDAAKILTKILTLWVRRNNVTDDHTPGLFDMALKNLGFLGFFLNLKNLKSPNLGFLGF